MRVSDPIFNLEDFEGPLDLLLHLVESKEIDIYRVVIEQVLAQYETHLKTLKAHDLDLGAEFLSIVSSLMLLKSKTLLPELKEEEDIIEESTLRLDIIEQLVYYYKFRDVALTLGEKESLQSSKYLRGVDTHLLMPDYEPELKPTDQSILSELFLKVLEKRKLSGIRVIDEEDYKISDKIKELRGKLKESSFLLFEEIFSLKKPKGELIALFIALLEILKQGYASLNQSENQWVIEPKKG